MDFQNRVGSRTGGGGMAGGAESNASHRERMRKLAMETIDINKDPYFMRNHLGSYECKLCLTLHTNEGSYLAHTQGKKHQTNLARRAAKDSINVPKQDAPKQYIIPKRQFIAIGRPGYQITKVQHPTTLQFGLLIQIQYPEIAANVVPRFRIMNAFEQKIEPPNNAHQYIVVAAEPYQTISFKVQNKEIDTSEGNKMWTHFDKDTKQYSLQFLFKEGYSHPAPMFEGVRAATATA